MVRIRSKISMNCEKCTNDIAKYVVEVIDFDGLPYIECWCRDCTWEEIE